MADVVEQPRRVRELAFGFVHPNGLGDVPREPRNRGRVPGGALIADVERAHQPGEHAP